MFLFKTHYLTSTESKKLHYICLCIFIEYVQKYKRLNSTQAFSMTVVKFADFPSGVLLTPNRHHMTPLEVTAVYISLESVRVS